MSNPEFSTSCISFSIFFFLMLLPGLFFIQEVGALTEEYASVPYAQGILIAVFLPALLIHIRAAYKGFPKMPEDYPYPA